MLLKEEIEDIKQKFKQVISYSQDIANPKVDILFEQWLTAKKDFISAFGNQLIYTYPKKVTFELDEKEKIARVDEFIDSVDNGWNNSELADFVYAMKDKFYSNLTGEDYTTSSGKIIKKGTKLVKAFKYFVPYQHILEEIQNQASRIIQENKVEGYLHLSVHPLDFLSASENAYNWRSCHALDGDYRSGNLTYMVDNSTFMCYLSNEKDEKIPNFPFKWNSKKWRVYMFLSDDWSLMFAGRQYPFFSQYGLDVITNEILPSLSTYKLQGASKWHTEILTHFHFNDTDEALTVGTGYIPIGANHELIELDKLIQDHDNSLHFNDLLHSSCYKPMYVYFNQDCPFSYPLGATSSSTRIHIGGPVMCMECENEYLDKTYSMICSNCLEDNDQNYYCDSCGRHVHTEDAIFTIDNYPLCAECASKYTKQCCICYQVDYTENMIYVKSKDNYYCPDCMCEQIKLGILKEEESNG